MKDKIAFHSDPFNCVRFSLLIHYFVSYTFRQRNEKIKISRYVEDVVPLYQPDDFKRFFRMGRGTVEQLCGQLHNTGNFDVQVGGRPAIPVMKQTLVFLWYMGSQDTLIQIADRFGITEFSVLEIRKRVSRSLIRLKEAFIRWPTGQARQETIQQFSFPTTLGALDGTHIRIQAPAENPETYINRKGFHSIVLQAVCKHDMVFTNCYAGWPGSVHDARVLRNSDLWDNGLQLCNGAHIVADGAYPLRKWIMTPYRNTGNLTAQQRNYNNKLSSSRVVIERAFGLFKGRLRRMQFLHVHQMQHAVELVLAACVLFNFCLLNADILDDYLVEDVACARPVFAENNAEGALKRDMIARRLAAQN